MVKLISESKVKGLIGSFSELLIVNPVASVVCGLICGVIMVVGVKEKMIETFQAESLFYYDA